uniref:Uncharacterized protein n=1 Tax=Peronospora matthiolae TaxID=2874970 RepID=A0AAV1T7T4_9STRA
MLSNRVDRGSALAATTARALGAVHGLSDPEDSDSSDRMASFDNDAFSVDDDAARPSDDKSLGQEATELPARARHTAVATSHTMDMTTTSYEAVSTAAIVDNVVDVSRTCDDRLGWQTPILPGRAGSDAPMPCGKEMSAGPCPLHDDCTPGRVGSMLPVGAAPDPVTTAAVPMGADQGSTWQAIATPPPSPHLVLLLGGKRRCLHERGRRGPARASRATAARGRRDWAQELSALAIRGRRTPGLRPGRVCTQRAALRVHAVCIHGTKLSLAQAPPGLKAPPHRLP